MARQIRPGQLQENVLYNISASFAVSASHEITHEVSSSYAESASFAVTASHALNTTPLPIGIVSGSAQITALGFVTSSATSSFVLNSQTSSFVNNSATASFVLNSQTASMSVESASFAVTASHLLNNPPAFPFTGDAQITGSLIVSGSNNRIEGSTVIYSTSTPGLTIQSNADTAEEVKIYDARIDIEDSGYMAARLSSNAYGSRAGVLDLRHWAGNVGAVITAQPSYTSYIQSSLLIGKTGTVNSSHAYKLDVNGDIKLGNGTDDSIEILGPVTASTDISSSAASTASFGTYLGDGSNLSGISTTPFPFIGDAVITGSLILSGSSPLLSLPDAPRVAMVISGSNDRTRLHIYDTEDNSSPAYTEGAGIVLTGGEGSAQAILEMSAVGSTNGGSNNEQTFIRSSEMLTIVGASAAAGDNIKLLGSSNYGLKLDASSGGVSLQYITNGGSTVSTLELGNGTYTKANASGTYYKIGRSSTDWLNLGSTLATFNGHVSSSATSTASFGTYIGDGSQLIGVLTTASVSLNTITFTKGDGSTFPITVDTGSGGGGGGVPSGTVSSSAQITELGFVTSSATASFVLNSQTSSMSVATASYIEYSNVANKPALVSGSAQISYAGITDIPAGILSSSAQIATDISGAFSSDSASFSTRVTANETSITSLNLVTGSYAITGSNTFTGNQTINGNLTVYGTGSFDVIHTIYETSSIIYASGSTKFGDTMDDTHVRTGSMFITGSVTALDYTGIFNGALSSSAQIATEISGAFATDSASFSTRITTNETNISTLTAATSSYLTATPTLQQVTDQGASTSNDITISGDLTASADISLPTNASYIKFNNAEIYGRVGGSYPGLHLASGQSSNSRIWLGDLANTTGAVTMSFLGVNNLFDNINNLRAGGNRPLILQGGAGPNDVNDGVRIQTGDASNVYQTRFEIEADGANVDAYFTNINGLGINDSTPTAMLDVNGNINTTSHITASGNILATGTVLGSNLSGTNTGDQDLSSYALITAVTGAFASDSASFSTRVTTLEGAGTSTPTFIASGSTSASSAPDTGVVVEHSGSTAFSVIGDVGTLFSVDDSLTGTLFSANDISGFPVLQAEADGDVYLGKSPQSLYTTAVISSNTANITQSIYGISTSSYAGAFIEYTAFSGSHDARAGSLMAIWSGSAVNFTETTTTDFGDTSNLLLQVAISQSQAQVQSYSTTAGYKIKTIIKAI